MRDLGAELYSLGGTLWKRCIPPFALGPSLFPPLRISPISYRLSHFAFSLTSNRVLLLASLREGLADVHSCSGGQCQLVCWESFVTDSLERDQAEVLDAFPTSIRSAVSRVWQGGGKIPSMVVGEMVQATGGDLSSLMGALVAVAARFAIVPISEFRVGAILAGREDIRTGWPNLYLGANIEFVGEALAFTVHAEQAACANAWHHEETTFQAIAASAPPCGLCRQFLSEFASPDAFKILLPNRLENRFVTLSLASLLPMAFSRRELWAARGEEGPSGGLPSLELIEGPRDDLVLAALRAAGHSHAPFSDNLSGCALQLHGGVRHVGWYAESAAYNPSLSPLQAAISNMNLNQPLGGERRIERAVLVEVPARAGQRRAAEAVLASFAPEVVLEYAVAALHPRS